MMSKQELAEKKKSERESRKKKRRVVGELSSRDSSSSLDSLASSSRQLVDTEDDLSSTSSQVSSPSELSEMDSSDDLSSIGSSSREPSVNRISLLDSDIRRDYLDASEQYYRVLDVAKRQPKPVTIQIKPTNVIPNPKGVICWDIDDTMFDMEKTKEVLNRVICSSDHPTKSASMKDLVDVYKIYQFINGKGIIACLKKATELDYLNICITARTYHKNDHDPIKRRYHFTGRGMLMALKYLAGDTEYFSQITYTNGRPKIGVLQAFARKHHFQPSQVYLIDDDEAHINDAIDGGFHAIAANSADELSEGLKSLVLDPEQNKKSKEAGKALAEDEEKLAEEDAFFEGYDHLIELNQELNEIAKRQQQEQGLPSSVSAVIGAPAVVSVPASVSAEASESIPRTPLRSRGSFAITPRAPVAVSAPSNGDKDDSAKDSKPGIAARLT